jgi:outer membrane lipoprotein SlyB
MTNAYLKSLAAIGLALAVAAPGFAHANCRDRRVGGTVIGAVAGGLLGNAVSHGGGRPVGTLLGAGAGAYAGHEIAGAGCHGYYRHDYYRYHHHHRYDGYR